jgi:acetoin utilization protein AcuB
MRDGGQETVRTVGELMSTEVVSVTPETSLFETIGMMVQRGIRHLPVMEDGRAVAVVSDRDIRVQISGATDPGERQRYLSSTNVMARASRPVTTISPDAPVQEAARIFVESRIGCLPVVDADDRVVGIVTQTDLLKWLASQAS